MPRPSRCCSRPPWRTIIGHLGPSKFSKNLPRYEGPQRSIHSATILVVRSAPTRTWHFKREEHRMSFPDYKADSIRFKIDHDAPTGRMYIDRISKLNAITMKMHRDLNDFSEKVDEDSRVRGVVLRGAGGKGFSAGGDIPQFLEVPVPQLANLAYSMSAPERCTKPVIAVIDGHCYGGGLELALSCDFRLATPAARLGFQPLTIGALAGSMRRPRPVRLNEDGSARN